MASQQEHKLPYMVEYRHKGETYVFAMYAESWEDCQERLRSIGYNGRVVGSNVQTGKIAAPGFVPLWMVALWLDFRCWLLNMRRRLK